MMLVVTSVALFLNQIYVFIFFNSKISYMVSLLSQCISHKVVVIVHFYAMLQGARIQLNIKKNFLLFGPINHWIVGFSYFNLLKNRLVHVFAHE